MKNPTLAFLGATGGCVGHCLALALQSGNYNCRALARTPAKLERSLATKGVTREALQRLTIIQGDAKDLASVKHLLTPSDASAISTVITGVGATPRLQFAWNPIALSDPHVCEQAMQTLLAALAALEFEGMNKPDVVAVSTTGITSGPRDVPLLLLPLYRWLLEAPHGDKRAMERQLWAQTKLFGKERATRSFVIVRPTLLTDARKGLHKVRWGGEGRPAVGYSVGRADVGEFIFEHVVIARGEKGTIRKDEAVALSY